MDHISTLTVDDSKERAIRVFARSGYAARGIVYLLVGGLTTLAALGASGDSADSRDALASVLNAPFGKILLAIIALGLLGYSIWRIVQSTKDPDNHGTDLKGLTIRMALFISAISHLLLAFYCASLIFTFSSSSSDSGGFTSWLMSQAFGRWLVGAVGIAVIGSGIAHGIKAWKVKFDDYLEMPSSVKHWAYPVCRFGLVIRGFVLVLAGLFFLVAAYLVNPEQAGGISKVFNTLREQAFGQWLLAFVAIGLFTFGLYSLLEAVYRRVALS